jgi:hypothetical protein
LQRDGHRETKRLRGLQIDHQLIARWPFDWDVTGLARCQAGTPSYSFDIT